jgi:hypothetical protein
MTLDVFNCSPTSPPDGKEYMAGMLDVVCGAPNSAQTILLPFAVLTLLGYSLGAPALGFWFLRRKRSVVKYDQILRARGTGDDKLTNPKFYRFRKMWHMLYYHFKPGKWYWEMIIVGRKFLIAFTSLMFRSTPDYQLAMALVVLFAAYVLHIRGQPYMTHADRPRILEEHLNKAMAGDPLHATIEADMRAVDKRNARGGASGAARSLESVAKGNGHAVDAAVFALFNYNTVEAVLLASAILVNLAGIMFNSARFGGDLAQYYEKEYQSLTGAVLALIGVTVIYYFTCFFTDVLVVCAPATAVKLCVCGRRVDEAKAAVAGKLARRAGGTAGSGGRVATKGALSAAASGGSGGDVHAMELSSNPLMQMAASRAGASGAPRSGDAHAAAAMAGISSHELMLMSEPPTGAEWAAMRATMAGVMDSVGELKAQLAAARRDAQQAALMDGGDDDRDRERDASGRRLAKVRREFDPQAVTAPGMAAGSRRSMAVLRGAARGGGDGEAGGYDASTSVANPLAVRGRATSFRAGAGEVGRARSPALQQSRSRATSNAAAHAGSTPPHTAVNPLAVTQGMYADAAGSPRSVVTPPLPDEE